MSGARRGVVGRTLLAGAGALLFGACANLFGLEAYEDASAALCDKCEAIPDCEARLDAKLAAASNDDLAGWLALYDSLGCAASLCDRTTLECFYRAPDNQVKDGEACLHSEGCESFDFDDPEKGGACCAGDGAGEGVCCAEGCLTCEEKLTSFIVQGDGAAQLCRSHEATWQAVVACRGKQCLAICKPPLLTPKEKDDCVACVAEACADEVDACLKNEAR